jgi:ABC-type transport system involved in cytochrome bd biosynthesis fused ATPase/permease subunit
LVLSVRGACQQDAVGPLSFEVPAGQWVALMGATGSGKTTVLRWLAGLQRPTEGEVVVGGAAPSDRPPEDRGTAYVPQDSMLFARTIGENVRLGRAEADDAAVRAVLERVAAAELDPHQGLRPTGAPLSGGERQRLALARALLLDRDVWLLDEPTAHLDGATRDRVVRGLQASRAGRTVVCATHDLALAAQADRVVVLEDGRVVSDGPPPRRTQRVGA